MLVAAILCNEKFRGVVFFFNYIHKIEPFKWGQLMKKGS